MNVRYALEHKLLPQMLFAENREEVLSALEQHRGELLVTLLNDIGSENSTKQYMCPYSANDFVFHPIVVGGKNGIPKVHILRIDMPLPKSPTDCYCVFILHKDGYGELAYYTLEKGIGGDPWLCAWDESGKHLNYGPRTNSIRDITVELGKGYITRLL